MSLSAFEAAALLLSLLPPGASDLYDLSPTGDPYLYFAGLADLLKQEALDLVDLLRAEVNPVTVSQTLAEWETATGLADTMTAKYGTVAARRAQVISKLRESGASTQEGIRAVVAPLVGYADSSQLAIIECPRAGLTPLHTYADGEGATVGSGASVSQAIIVPDDGVVSRGGALLAVTLYGSPTGGVTISLAGSGPSPAQKTWTSLSGTLAGPHYLYFPEAAGKTAGGTWTITVANAGSITVGLVSWSLFIEGVNRDSAGIDGLGAAIYRWAVLVDPALAVGPDYPAVRRALRRIEPAHTHGDVALKMSGSSSYAICDDANCVADQCLCGT